MAALINESKNCFTVCTKRAVGLKAKLPVVCKDAPYNRTWMRLKERKCKLAAKPSCKEGKQCSAPGKNRWRETTLNP